MQATREMSWSKALIAAAGCAVLCGDVVAQPFGLHIVQPTSGFRRVNLGGMSADGRVVGAWSSDRVSPTSPYSAAFLDRFGGTRTEFTDHYPLYASTAIREVSGDGDSAAGSFAVRIVPSNTQPARFDRTTGQIEGLGFLPGYEDQNGGAWGIDARGDVLVGWFYRQMAPGVPEEAAFRWTRDGGMRALSGLPGDHEVKAHAVSRDGRVTIGESVGTTVVNAVMWIDDGPAQVLPQFNPPGIADAVALGVAARGDWIVGRAALGSGTPLAVVWDSDGLIQLLTGPALSNASASGAWAVSDDGQVIVGVASGLVPGNDLAFVWRPETGAVLLSDYLQEFGISVPDNVMLTGASALSADGRTIAGSAVVDGVRQTYVVTVPAPSALAGR